MTVEQLERELVTARATRDAAQKRAGELLEQTRQQAARIEELERRIINSHGRALPSNWVYTDAETTLDLLVAEVTTTRVERDEALAKLKRSFEIRGEVLSHDEIGHKILESLQDGQISVRKAAEALAQALSGGNPEFAPAQNVYSVAKLRRMAEWFNQATPAMLLARADEIEKEGAE